MARNRLVLVVPRDSKSSIASFRDLADARVRRVAVANPDHAPYGRAAVAALRSEKLYDAVSGKLVMGENISQAAQFAQSGSADAGLIALSLALSPAMKSAGGYVEVPESLHPPIAQAAVVVSSSRNKTLARQFVETLKKPEVIRILQSYGFAPPAERGMIRVDFGGHSRYGALDRPDRRGAARHRLFDAEAVDLSGQGQNDDDGRRSPPAV